MAIEKPSLFGIRFSNRNFENKESWGKNQFNSSFPAALSAFLSYKGLRNVYLTLTKEMRISRRFITTTQLYGMNPDSHDLFYSFETAYPQYQQLVVGQMPRIDLVTQRRRDGLALKPLEIKLTTLPDNSTCDESEDRYGAELVVRPDTIVYLACSIASNFADKPETLKEIIGSEFESLIDWTDAEEVLTYMHRIIRTIDAIVLSVVDFQQPLLIQPIWKTIGKSPVLSDNCLDVFVWSNLAFIQVFLDVAKRDLVEAKNKITRQNRTVVWLFKMLYDFARYGQINHGYVVDEMSFNTKNDKAFSMNGKMTWPYMKSPELLKPRILKNEIKHIILG
ncbi:MAG: HindVP family restriction endonuclease, partial [Chlorobi bacterium CHB2]|nr:HindVP family restriction endonuclease [Chlorobi bacterium CHB2]